MEKGKMLYEGKAKQIFETENPEEVIVRFKDDATAFNAQKRGQFDRKGELNNVITTLQTKFLQIRADFGIKIPSKSWIKTVSEEI